MIMKTINKYLFLLAAVVFGLTACEKQQQREPSPAGNPKAIAFEQSSIVVEINPSKAALEYVINVGRSSADEELSATIKVEGDIDIIKVPTTVNFAKGELTTTLKLTFPDAQVDSMYAVLLSIDSINQSPYTEGNTQCAFAVAIAAWEPAETKAIVFDGIVNVFYSTGSPGWYVPYLLKENKDGSFDIRLLNPYTILPEYKDGDYDSPVADKFELYGGFPYNYPEDVDSKGTYNMNIHVDANDSATFDTFELGMIWSYGMFSGAQAASKGKGVYDKAANTITFPGGTVACAMAGYNDGAFYLGEEDMVIYLDAQAYQNDHLSISDFNDPSIEWEEQETVVNVFESKIFNFTNEEQKLYKAVDQYPGNPKSPFINLWCIKDAYAEGGNLAFYWDGKTDTLLIPTPQNTQLSFMKKDLYIVEAAGTVAVNDVKGTAVTVFTFAISVSTIDGNYVGDFVETFSVADEAIVFKKEDFIGTFNLNGYDVFEGTPAVLPIEIAEAGDKLAVIGIDQDTIWAEFDDATGVLSIAPQMLPDSFSYKGANYARAFFTLDEKFNESDELPLLFAFKLSGTAVLTADCEAVGYLIYLPELEGALDGLYDLTLEPTEAGAPGKPAKAPASLRSKSEIRKHELRSTNKPSASHLSFQGVRLKAAKAL